MHYRTLGRSGLHVSAVSFGSWVTFANQLAGAQAQACMVRAYEAGVNFFDNAEVYADGESERIMGRALAALKWPRDSYLVSSKVFWGGSLPTQRGLSRKHVVEACHQALGRLQVDHLDLYFCHRPDLSCPIAETVLAMHTLIVQGKILYWGTSEWTAAQLTEAFAVAERHGWTPPTMEQPQYNLFHRANVEVDLLPLVRDRGLGTTVWSPLASGILSGKYSDGIPAGSRLAMADKASLRERHAHGEGRRRVEQAARLAVLAGELGMAPATLAVAWCLRHPHVSTVILGASRAEQLDDTLRAPQMAGLLTAEVLARIEGIFDNAPAAPRDHLER